MVRMNKLNPIHNPVEPLIVSIESSKIAPEFRWNQTRVGSCGASRVSHTIRSF